MAAANFLNLVANLAPNFLNLVVLPNFKGNLNSSFAGTFLENSRLQQCHKQTNFASAAKPVGCTPCHFIVKSKINTVGQVLSKMY